MKERFSTKLVNQIFFILPAVILFSMFVLIPFLFSTITSFSKWNGISNGFSWVGIENYKKVLEDENFRNAFIYTMKNMLAVTIIANSIGVIFAILLTAGMKASGFFRTVLVLPNILSGIILGFIWKFIFMKGLPAIGETLGIQLFQITWLGSPNTAFWSIVIVNVWQMSGYVMLVYIAGILSIPSSVLESAYTDGSTNFQLLKYIIFPYLKPALGICIFWTISKSLVLFDLPFALTQGGPFKSTETLAIHIYREAFEKNNYGYGSAKALVFFGVVVCFSALQVYVNNRKEE